MRRELLLPLAIGLLAVVVGAALVLRLNQGAHLRLEGLIQKVRTQDFENACAVVVDFRATNPADVPMVVRSVRLVLTDAEGRELEGAVVSEPDARSLFQHYTGLGQKFNDTLKARDRIVGGETVDRMVAARFEMPESQAASRKALKVVIEDVDGAVAEIFEGRPR